MQLMNAGQRGTVAAELLNAIAAAVDATVRVLIDYRLLCGSKREQESESRACVQPN